MTGLTNYTADSLLNWLTGQVPQPSLPVVYMGLFTAVGTDAGTGFTEVSGGSYARVQVAGSLTTNGTTANGNNTLHFASVPSWLVAGMSIYDTTAPSVVTGLTVLSTTVTTVVMSGNASGAGVGGTDVITFSAFAQGSGTGPASLTNTAVIGFAQATADWTAAQTTPVIAWGLFDASSSGNLLVWDYLGNFAWLPATVSAASPGVVTAHAHGYSNADSFVFSTEIGGTAPTFSAGNYTGLKTVAGVTTDTFNVTGVNTSATGNGMVRKVTQQSIPQGVTASFAASTLTAQAA